MAKKERWLLLIGNVSILVVVLPSTQQTGRWFDPLFSLWLSCWRGANTLKAFGSYPFIWINFYDSLDECVNNIVHSIGQYDTVTYADTSFLKMFP